MSNFILQSAEKKIVITDLTDPIVESTEGKEIGPAYDFEDYRKKVNRYVEENGNFIRWFEGKVNDAFENFGDMLKEIIRMLKEESKISKKAEDLFMKFMKNAEEREKEGRK